MGSPRVSARPGEAAKCRRRYLCPWNHTSGDSDKNNAIWPYDALGANGYDDCYFFGVFHMWFGMVT